MPADAVTCSALGAHALCALTAVHVQDTTGIEDVHLLPPDLVDEQARCLLEDMSVQAIKAGPIYTSDTARVIAQIAADYNDVPLVLHLAALPQALSDEDTEDAIAATLELLLPQTDLVMADESLLARWEADGLVPSSSQSQAENLLKFGAQWVLSSGAQLRPGQRAHMLYGPEQTVLNWPWQAPSTRIPNLDGLVACALSVELARGTDVPQAVDRALQSANRLAASTFRPGMGTLLINRATP